MTGWWNRKSRDMEIICKIPLKSIKHHRNNKDADADNADAIIAYWGKDKIVSLNKGKLYLSTKYRRGIIYSHYLFIYLDSV